MESQDTERRVDKLEWDMAQLIKDRREDRDALVGRISELSSTVKTQSEDIDKLRTWRAQMVAVLMAATTAISLLIKKFWN
jgi:uncharacterized coiled-coil protein SlyX